MKKQTIIYAIIGVLLLGGAIGGGIYFYQSNNNASKTDNTTKTETVSKTELTGNEVVSYKGEAGKTALELLQQNATILTSGEGTNAFVTTINGKTADSSSEYWQFKINGTPAEVGAGSYVTKDSDTITWELSSF